MKKQQITSQKTDTKTIKLTVKLTLWVFIIATFLMLGLEAGAPFASVYKLKTETSGNVTGTQLGA